MQSFMAKEELIVEEVPAYGYALLQGNGCFD